MIYNNHILKEAERIYSARRERARAISEYNRNKLFDDEIYLNAYNAYKSAQFELSKAKYLGDNELCDRMQKVLKDNLDAAEKRAKELGISENMTKPAYVCKQCEDTGYTPDGKTCACLKPLAEEIVLSDLGIGKKPLPDFSETTVKDVNDLDGIYEKMKKYCKEFENIKKFLVIMGDVGTGKSFLAGCIANEIRKKGLTVVFLSAYELNSIFLKYVSAPPTEKSVYLDVLTECDLLVIDDLGAEPSIRNVTSEYLYVVISQRISTSAPFIVTTNLDGEKICERYGDRILSRLHDKSRGILFRIDGKDLRILRKK
ncbi:MAG: ATP-binding protein [Clostridia bacterium]|nr:ATP-binding protein [Clostridia bacterium]